MLLVETFAGVRPEEAARLQWNDIDLAKGKVRVQIRRIDRYTLRDTRHIDDPQRLWRSGPVKRALIQIARQLARKVSDQNSVKLGAGLLNQELPEDD